MEKDLSTGCGDRSTAWAVETGVEHRSVEKELSMGCRDKNEQPLHSLGTVKVMIKLLTWSL